ncbi:MAG: hypothetical protein K0Q93_208 [Nocardioidaceae bacterium]|jgi:hypothetical protein|nr:hypothetical protein [Nocardioidaceae bacterium]
MLGHARTLLVLCQRGNPPAVALEESLVLGRVVLSDMKATTAKVTTLSEGWRRHATDYRSDAASCGKAG